MSFHVNLTAPQARAVAALAYDNGASVSLRQLVSPGSPGEEDDVYATVHGHSEGYRISAEGMVHEVAHLLPAP